MKKFLLYTLACVMALSMVSCGNKIDNKIIIYSSSEEFRNEHLTKRLKEQFPQYEIDLQYMSTGNLAAKLKAEGTKIECDIVYGVEDGYLEQNKDVLSDLSSYDTSAYIDNIVPSHKKFLPEERVSTCIIMREDILAEKGLAIPQNYQDLLKPEYKGLISMANPKSSSTGFAFLKGLTNAWGETKALDYFDKLTPNILQYTSSGSGPVNALVQGEAAIGLGMTFQAVVEINKGAPLKLAFFEEGSPNMFYGNAVVSGRLEDPAVKEVFDFITDTLVLEDKQFSPEIIFKGQKIEIENYPIDIPYCDMSSKGDMVEEKMALLEKWTH